MRSTDRSTGDLADPAHAGLTFRLSVNTFRHDEMSSAELRLNIKILSGKCRLQADQSRLEEKLVLYNAWHSATEEQGKLWPNLSGTFWWISLVGVVHSDHYIFLPRHSSYHTHSEAVQNPATILAR